MSQTHQGDNYREREFAAWATEQGWRPTKRGWPDFWLPGMCAGDGGCVEVKTPATNLTRAQAALTDWLMAYGIPCFRWDEKYGLRRLTIPTANQEPRSRTRPVDGSQRIVVPWRP
jgi:hypothetical protein